LTVFSGIPNSLTISLRVSPLTSFMLDFRKFFEKSNKKFHFSIDVYETLDYT
jgi:hypothetical protein